MAHFREHGPWHGPFPGTWTMGHGSFRRSHEAMDHGPWHGPIHRKIMGNHKEMKVFLCMFWLIIYELLIIGLNELINTLELLLILNYIITNIKLQFN